MESASNILIDALIKRFGRSFDIHEHEFEIIRMDEFIAYERAIGTRYMDSIVSFRSLDGMSFKKSFRIRITTACDLFLFDVIKK